MHSEPRTPPSSLPAFVRSVILLMCVLAAVFVGYLLGVGSLDRTAWATYAPVFDEVAPVVVNVTIEGPPARVGSGFAISENLVVTARHLVLSTDRVTIRDITGTEVAAQVVGTDARADLALLKTERATLKPARLGDSTGLRIGDTVLAIGNPYGLSHSLAVGVVGNRGRRLVSGADGPRVGFIQLSMPLNPGNSGGALFDASGQVVGVLTGTHSQGQAIAFAVPVEALAATLPALRSGKRVSRAFLGLRVRSDAAGIYVQEVIPSSPADKAGIRTGDYLSAFDQIPITSVADFHSTLDALSGGRPATVRLLRDGQLLVVDVVLVDWAEQPVAAAGMILTPFPGTGGRVVALRPGSRADRAGVRQDDVIRSVNGVPTQAPAAVKELLIAKEAHQLEIVRDNITLILQLP